MIARSISTERADCGEGGGGGCLGTIATAEDEADEGPAIDGEGVETISGAGGGGCSDGRGGGGGGSYSAGAREGAMVS